MKRRVVSALVVGICAPFLVYGVFCLSYAAFEVGLESRLLVLAHSSLACVLLLIAIALAGRQLVPNTPLRTIAVYFSLAILVSSLSIVAYRHYRSSLGNAYRWSRLAIVAADARTAASGDEALAGSPISKTSIRTLRADGVQVLEVFVNEPLTGSIFGVDLLALDSVEIELGPNGRPRTVRTIYF